MELTIADIATRIAPIAKANNLGSVWLFGSRARGDAMPDSDVDLLINTTGTPISSLTRLSRLYLALKDALGTDIDLVTVEGIQENLRNVSSHRKARIFKQEIDSEKVLIYESEEQKC